jgi:hypothetical protein
VIAARHFVARCPSQRRYTAHKCSANAEYVYVHSVSGILEWIYDHVHVKLKK